MSCLVCNLMLVVLHSLMINGSTRTFHWVYKPYGPKMCSALYEEKDFSFRYLQEDLSCRRIAANDSRNTDNNSFENTTTCSKVDSRVTKMLSLANSSAHEIITKGVKDGSGGISTVRPELTSPAPCKDSRRNMSLMAACIHGNLCKVKYFLYQGLEDINRQNDKGLTPLMLAAIFGRKAVFDYLVSQNCNLTYVDNDYNTILHLAVEGQSYPILKKLLVMGKCGIEARNGKGQTPVMWAIIKFKSPAFFLFVKNGCNLKVVDNERNNILHLASQVGSGKIVKYILEKNIIDYEIINKSGKTPLEIAKELNNKYIADLISKKRKEDRGSWSLDFFKELFET